MKHAMVYVFLLLLIGSVEPSLSMSVDDEGMALLRFKAGVEVDPCSALSNWGDDDDQCSWFGVQCDEDGRVIALNLKDLSLEGTLTPELGKLIHMESLNLNNNSLYGTIPREIGAMQKLQVLDLGHNNFSGPIPSELCGIFSLEILVLRSNKLLANKVLDLDDLDEVDQELSSSNARCALRDVNNATIRRHLKVVHRDRGQDITRHGRNFRIREQPPSPSPSPSPMHSRPIFHLPVTPSFRAKFPSAASPSHSPSDATASPVPVRSPHPKVTERQSPELIPAPPIETSVQTKHKTSRAIYLSIGGSISCLITLSAIYIFCCRTNKISTVMPWATGLSEQLQKALVTGVPSLKRAELERACEDFSNVIGTDGTLFKGTLSSGVEIAVTTTVITDAKDWSDQCEAQFKKKISMLSKVNHKNFMNLLGYCTEEEPFTRMMVFEYAPNGTLFEHLHIREAEHLNWNTRLRIAMGIAYCVEHLGQLNPPVVVTSLNSSSIYLTDDYAAKVSDLVLWSSHEHEAQQFDGTPMHSSSLLSEPLCIVYKFGIILLELISGRRPFSEDDGLLVLWASSYLNGQRPLRDIVDSTLESFNEEDVSALCELIRPCISPNPQERLTMAEFVEGLRRITHVTPDGALPKLSPLWWAELEIISSAESS